MKLWRQMLGIFERKEEDTGVSESNVPNNTEVARPEVGAAARETGGGGHQHPASDRQRTPRLLLQQEQQGGEARGAHRTHGVRDANPTASSPRPTGAEASCRVGDKPNAVKAMLGCTRCQFVTVHTRDNVHSAWWRCDQCATNRKVSPNEGAIILDDGKRP